MVATVIVNELGATKVIQHCAYGSQLPWEKRPSFFSPRALIIAAHAPLALRITLYLILLFMVSFVGIVIIKLHSIPLLCAIIATPLMAIALSFHYSVFKKKVLKGISPEKIVLETYYLGLRLRRKLFDRSLIHLQSGRHSVNGPKFQLNRAMYSIYLTDTKHSALVFESEIADEVLEEINNIQTFLEGAA